MTLCKRPHSLLSTPFNPSCIGNWVSPSATLAQLLHQNHNYTCSFRLRVYSTNSLQHLQRDDNEESTLNRRIQSDQNDTSSMSIADLLPTFILDIMTQEGIDIEALDSRMHSSPSESSTEIAKMSTVQRANVLSKIFTHRLRAEISSGTKPDQKPSSLFSSESNSFSHQERQFLGRLLHLKPAFTESLWRRKKHYNRHGSAVLTPDEKQYIREWINDRENQHQLTLNEMRQLASTLNVSLLTVKRAVYHLKQKPGIITPEKKLHLTKWLRQNNSKRPNSEQLDQLEKDMDLARFQIFNLVTYMKAKPPGKITKAKKQIIEQWLKKNDNATPTGVDRRMLEEKTGLNSYQVRRCVQVIRGNARGIPDEAKQIVSAWRKQHKYRKPTKGERQELLSQTGLNPYQLTMLLSIKPPKKNATLPNNIVKQLDKYMDLNNTTKHEADIIQDLCATFNLESSQVNHYMKLRERKLNLVAVSETSRGLLQKWTLEKGRLPSSSEKSILELQTGLNREQLNTQLKKMNLPEDDDSATNQMKSSQSVSLSSNISDAIHSWLKSRDYRLPTKSERQDLLDAHGVSSKQLTDLLYRLRKKHGVLHQQ